MSLQSQIVSIPVSQGLDTKTDSKQVMAGSALVLENARFQKTGKLSKRFGLVQLTSTSDSGLISANEVKTIVSDDQSISAITSSGIYSLSVGQNSWQNVSDMKDFARVKTSFISKSANNQYGPDTDYDSVSGLQATAYREYEENNNLVTPRSLVTLVVRDLKTGLEKIVKVSSVPGVSSAFRTKVMINTVAGSTYIMLFYDNVGTQLRLKVFNANLVQLSDSTPITIAGGAVQYWKDDVCKDSSNVYAAVMYDNTLKVVKFDLTGTLVTSNTLTTTNRLATNGASQAGYGFSICQTASLVHVLWVTNATGTPFDSDIVALGLSKTTLASSVTETKAGINGSVGLPSIRDISFTTKSAVELVGASMQYGSTGAISISRIGAIWTTTYTFTSNLVNFEDMANRATIISRPWMINDQAFVMCKCGESDQTTGLVYNLDTRKYVANFSLFNLSVSRDTNDGLYTPITGTSSSFVINGIAYSALERLYGVNTNAIGAFDFNANIAIANSQCDFNNSITAGTKAKVGETIYYTNGSTFCVDARGGYESGFFLTPKATVAEHTGTPNPNVASKTFSYIVVYEYYNGKGELEQSGISTAVSITTGINADYIIITAKNPKASFKSRYDSTFGTEKYSVGVVAYRTQNNGTVYYRVSSTNAQTFSDTVTIYDASSDANIQDNKLLYTTGGVLENSAVPNASFSTAGGNRLFVGGLEDKDEIAYSKKQLFAEQVQFSGLYRIRVSSGTTADRSPISALGYLDGKLIIFRERSVFYVAGDGPLETGLDNLFTEPEVISSDVGCVEPRSVLNTKDGVMFKSRKGIYLLDRSLQISYIGAPVEDFNSQPVCSAIVSDKFNEARFYTTSGTALVYNYVFATWSVFTNQTIVDADNWTGSPVSIRSNLIYQETENTYLDAGAAYSMRFISPWLKLGNIQGYQRCYQFWMIGEYKSPHTLNCKIYQDYDDTVHEDYQLIYSATDSPQYQFQVSLPVQKVQAIKFELYDSAQTGTAESYDLSNIQCEIAVKAGGYKLAATKSY